MAIPNSRATFKSYCLRNLGDGAIRINVTDDQVNDRVDEAIQYFRDYHFDGSSRMYFKHQVTSTDVTNQYIELNDPLIADVVRILDITGLTGQANMFDIRYQIALNDLYTITQQSLVPFYMTMQHLSLLEQMLQGTPSIRFNRYQNRVNIDMDWKNKVKVGTWIVIECDRQIDPDVDTAMWGDRWLARYATALIKRQWGGNLSKMTIQLPGGVSFNGNEIKGQADEEIADLEEKMINDYSLPVDFRIG